MNEPISRLDFLNGALLASAGLLLHYKAPTILPEDAFNGYGGVGDYSQRINGLSVCTNPPRFQFPCTARILRSK